MYLTRSSLTTCFSSPFINIGPDRLEPEVDEGGLPLNCMRSLVGNVGAQEFRTIQSLKWACRRAEENLRMPGRRRTSALARMATPVYVIVVALMLLGLVSVEGLPFPAPKVNACVSTFSRCCPTKSNVPPIPFALPGTSIPMRMRRAAHLVDATYIVKYRRAYELMKALPASDPRSLVAQAKLHCAYCGAAFTFPGKSQYGLEIHDGWFFFPWHRMFLYFHERILGSLIGDNTFTLPFWNWDNQGTAPPLANTMPSYYVPATYGSKQLPNPLYDANRNRCAMPPHLIDLNSGGGCSSLSPKEVRTENNRLMHNQMATATTPLVFFGSTYRFGWEGGVGGGNIEGTPHGPVHIFTGNPTAKSNPYDDMGNLDRAANDPLFYAHHANIDRLWEVWKAGGGKRVDIKDPDYLNSQFIFYDEKKRLVSIKVSQVLNTANLRYYYQNVANPWANPISTSTMDVSSMDPTSGESMEAVKCAPPNLDIVALIKKTPYLKKTGTVCTTKPLTFRVARADPSGKSEEVVVFQNLSIDWTKTAVIHAFLFYPGASGPSIDCLEYFGTFTHIPEANHMKKKGYTRLWVLGLTAKLTQLGLTEVSDIVITLVQVDSAQIIKFSTVTVEVEK